MSELSLEEVREILDLVERSHFDFFELRLGDLTLTASKSGVPPSLWGGASAQTTPSSAAVPIPPSPPPPPPASPVVGATPGRAAEESSGDDGLVAVTAPIVGTFYAQDEPGAPPFVEVGSRVSPDTTLGLVEIMKVFNAIRAGVSGVIEVILVENAQFVEPGQALFRIRPDDVAPREGGGLP